MGRNRVMATMAIGVAAAASVASVAIITIAAQAAPAGTGHFATWQRAEKAAGFELLKPTKTYGLRKASDIIVARCEISKKKASKRNVIGQYGPTVKLNLTISENNSNAPCARLRESKALGTYKIDGVKAYLTGDCDSQGLPSCLVRQHLPVPDLAQRWGLLPGVLLRRDAQHHRRLRRRPGQGLASRRARSLAHATASMGHGRGSSGWRFHDRGNLRWPAIRGFHDHGTASQIGSHLPLQPHAKHQPRNPPELVRLPSPPDHVHPPSHIHGPWMLSGPVG